MTNDEDSIPAPHALTPEQREVWNERVAICTLDGGLSESEAEAIAWSQIEREFGPLTSSPTSRFQEPHHAD